MRPIRLGLEADGHELLVAVGQAIVIRLPENPSTGFRWSMRTLEGPVELVHDDYSSSGSADPGVGAERVRVLTFETLGEGRAHLVLKKMQEWEGEGSAQASFTCRFRVVAHDDLSADPNSQKG